MHMKEPLSCMATQRTPSFLRYSRKITLSVLLFYCGTELACATRGRTVAFVRTSAAFLTRAFDQIRKGAISQTRVSLSGSHCRVSVGEDGPSHMALEDLDMFRSIPNCTVFYPSDAVSTEHAVYLAASPKGVVLRSDQLVRNCSYLYPTRKFWDGTGHGHPPHC